MAESLRLSLEFVLSDADNNVTVENAWLQTLTTNEVMKSVIVADRSPANNTGVTIDLSPYTQIERLIVRNRSTEWSLRATYWSAYLDITYVSPQAVTFVDSNPDTCVLTPANVVADGYQAGSKIRLFDTSRVGTYEISSAVAGTLTLVDDVAPGSPALPYRIRGEQQHYSSILPTGWLLSSGVVPEEDLTLIPFTNTTHGAAEPVATASATVDLWIVGS